MRPGPRKIVVIGSGIGGMATGALLAKAGYEVSVLEQNPTLIGGHGRCRTIRGLSFSMGPQYVWNFGKDQIGDRFMRFLDIGAANPFISMKTDGFERLLIGDRSGALADFFLEFDVPMGLERFGRKLKDCFPGEARSLSFLFDDMLAIWKAYQTCFKRPVDGGGRLGQTAGFLFASGLALHVKTRFCRSACQSLSAFFDQYGISELPRRILYGHGGIFAENEADMSAVAYIIGTGNYHQGAWYPKNGFSHFFHSLKSVIDQAGGAVYTGKQVLRMDTAGRRATRAICSDGSAFDADIFISDISPRLTCALLGRSRSAGRLRYQPSHSIITCCIGLEKGLPEISAMNGGNLWWQTGSPVNYREPDVTASPRMLFVASPTANGFGRAAGCRDDALVVFCPGHYNQEKAIHKAGSAAEKRFKEQLAAHIVDILEKNGLPGICSRLRFVEVLSSVDIESETGGEQGNAYGRRLSAAEIRKGPIRSRSMPDNLYNVSATANSPGIAAGIATAIKTFETLTGHAI